MLSSPFLRRLLLCVISPTLVAMLLVLYIASLNISELKIFSNKMYSSFALSSWQQLSEAYLAKAAIETTAVTRDRQMLVAFGSEDTQKMSESLTPTFNRLKASGILDGLYVYNLSSKILFSAGVKTDNDFTIVVSETIEKGKPVFHSMLNKSGKSLQYVYSFPLYEIGKINGVAMYIKTVDQMLNHLTAVNGLTYGVYSVDGFVFNNFAFDAAAVNTKTETVDSDKSKYSLVSINLPVRNSDSVYLTIAKENTKSLQQLDYYRTLCFMAVLISILLISVVLFMVIKAVAKVLIDSADCMNKLSEQNFDFSLPEYKYNDEVAKIIAGVSNVRERLVKAREAEMQYAQQEKFEKGSKLKEIVSGFEKEVNRIVDLIMLASKELSHESDALGNSISSTDSTVGSVNMITGESLANMKVVTGTTQELAVAIENISTLTGNALSVISESVKLTDGVSMETEQLEKAANDIGEIVGMIQDVAEQTNLLALNATIEAARAGDMGKGFAVVASEVKELATQTAKATDKISQRISDMQSISKSVVASISGIRNSVDSVNRFSSDIASSVREQSQATGAIDKNIHNVSGGIENISRNMQKVVDEVRNIKDVARNVLGSSSKLNEQIDGIHGCIGKLRVDLENLQE